MHQLDEFSENPSTDNGDIAETSIRGCTDAPMDKGVQNVGRGALKTHCIVVAVTLPITCCTKWIFCKCRGL